MSLRCPRTIEEFLAPPTREQWLAALRMGWPGPDGSSSSTDTIFGVRIGITSAKHEHASLPANLHDWRYLLGRTFRLGEEYRQAADDAHPWDLWAACYAELTGWRTALLPAAWARCWTRWAVLRSAGWWSFTAKQKEIQLAWHGDLRTTVIV